MRKKNYTKIKTNYKSYKEGDKVFRNYRAGKCFWEDGIVTRRTGRVSYIIQGSKFVCKRHINPLKPRYIETVQNNQEILMEVLYDSFLIKPPMNVGMTIEATTKQKLLILLNVKVYRLRGELVVRKGRGINTYVLIQKEQNTENKIR